MSENQEQNPQQQKSPEELYRTLLKQSLKLKLLREERQRLEESLKAKQETLRRMGITPEE